MNSTYDKLFYHRMGQKKWNFTNSRSEFFNDGMLQSSMEYQRKKGCFVSTKKAVALAILAIAVAATVVALMYFYGPQKKVVTVSISRGCTSW